MNESEENERALEAFGDYESRGIYGRLALGSAQHSIHDLDEEEDSLPSVDVNNIL